jgi:hypothetical protein
VLALAVEEQLAWIFRQPWMQPVELGEVEEEEVVVVEPRKCFLQVFEWRVAFAGFECRESKSQSRVQSQMVVAGFDAALAADLAVAGLDYSCLAAAAAGEGLRM